jgi:PrsW family intramembrane metalloprotease
MGLPNITPMPQQQPIIQNAPGYPQYPQGGYGYPQYPYGWNGYGYPPYGQYYYTPPIKRDTYRMVVAIISIIMLALLLLGGFVLVLALFGLAALPSSMVQQFGIVLWPILTLLSTAALIGGGVGLFLTIRALMNRPSAPAYLPSFWLPLSLTIILFAFIIFEYTQGLATGNAWLLTPIILMAGILPALTIFSLASERLGYPATWRHVWLSFLSGTFLATLLAIILEAISENFLAQALQSTATQINTTNTNGIALLILTLSAIAPLVEEGMKPIGALVIIGRLASPAEAFIVGMAGGIGFNIFETIGYITQGLGDWTVVAIERAGSGLLHGLGAGMATLGWYYIFRGQGIKRRFGKGIGALLYAITQHSIFNGANFLLLVPGPLGSALSAPIWFFWLPETGQIYLFVGLYAAITSVLLIVTHRIHRSKTTNEAENSSPPAENPIQQPALSSTITAPQGGIQ